MTDYSRTEQIELEALVNCIYQHCGYDFRHYAPASLYRMIQHELERDNLSHISELIPEVLYQPERLGEFVQNLSVNVTDFFRDPTTYARLVEQVFPTLKSFPFIKIWYAGCATGKEVYSLAMLLAEADLLDRTTLYATDFNHAVLSQAQSGIYPCQDLDEMESRYRAAGGQSDLRDYFETGGRQASIHTDLRDHITFAHHNLATDSVFGEMQLIICKNVMIYFNRQLKQKVLNLFCDSLYQGGFLCLGATESLDVITDTEVLTPVAGASNVYKHNPASYLGRDSLHPHTGGFQ